MGSFGHIWPGSNLYWSGNVQIWHKRLGTSAAAMHFSLFCCSPRLLPCTPPEGWHSDGHGGAIPPRAQPQGQSTLTAYPVLHTDSSWGQEYQVSDLGFLISPFLTVLLFNGSFLPLCVYSFLCPVPLSAEWAPDHPDNAHQGCFLVPCSSATWPLKNVGYTWERGSI